MQVKPQRDADSSPLLPFSPLSPRSSYVSRRPKDLTFHVLVLVLRAAVLSSASTQTHAHGWAPSDRRVINTKRSLTTASPSQSSPAAEKNAIPQRRVLLMLGGKTANATTTPAPTWQNACSRQDLVRVRRKMRRRCCLLHKALLPTAAVLHPSSPGPAEPPQSSLSLLFLACMAIGTMMMMSRIITTIASSSHI